MRKFEKNIAHHQQETIPFLYVNINKELYFNVFQMIVN